MSRFKNLFSRIGRFYLRHPVKLTILGTYVLAIILTGTVIGRVTDAVTGEPIKGAVVMASWEWVLPIPPEGEPVNVRSETVSGKNGWFIVCRPTLLILSYPTLTIYKSEHVVWNNRRLFDGRNRGWPNREQRPYRLWMDVSLSPWVEGMSHCIQNNFLDSLFRVGGGSTDLMLEAKKSERNPCLSERRKIRLLEKNRILEGEKP